MANTMQFDLVSPERRLASLEVSAVQMTKGFARIGNLIEDLSLDVPNAKERFEEIKKMAHETETHVSVLIDDSDREAF